MQQNSKFIEQIKKIGLSDKEAHIYTTLLEHGGGYASVIAERAGVNRSTTYAILTDLAIKGLVMELQKGKKLYYQLEPPHRLEQYANDGIRIAQRRKEMVERVLPDIEGLFTAGNHKPRIRFFEGIDGVCDVYTDHVSGNMPYEMVGYSNVGKLTQYLPNGFLLDYIKKKQRIGITSRGIFPDTEKDINYNETMYAHVSKKIWPELRFIPAAQFPYESEITMYGTTKISIVNFEEDVQVGVIIEDITIHQMLRMIFDLAWQSSQQQAKKE